MGIRVGRIAVEHLGFRIGSSRRVVALEAPRAIFNQSP
jgi:hypothetical protein